MISAARKYCANLETKTKSEKILKISKPIKAELNKYLCNIVCTNLSL